MRSFFILHADKPANLLHSNHMLELSMNIGNLFKTLFWKQDTTRMVSDQLKKFKIISTNQWNLPPLGAVHVSSNGTDDTFLWRLSVNVISGCDLNNSKIRNILGQCWKETTRTLNIYFRHSHSKEVKGIEPGISYLTFLYTVYKQTLVWLFYRKYLQK